MDMNCDCKHELVAHDLVVALVVVAASVVAFAVDGNAIELADNNIHFDCVNHPKEMIILI